MDIQVIGTLKCKESHKAIRFFKDRNIKFHFLDLNEKPLSKGELKNIANRIPLDSLMNTSSKEYDRRGLKYQVFDIFEQLLENPQLIKTPIVRKGKQVCLGYVPEELKKMITV